MSVLAKQQGTEFRHGDPLVACGATRRKSRRCPWRLAYLCDVYVLDAHRGRGLGEWLVGFALADPALADLRRISLATRDAHGLYAKFGFAVPQWANAYMDIVRPDITCRRRPRAPPNRRTREQKPRVG